MKRMILTLGVMALAAACGNGEPDAEPPPAAAPAQPDTLPMVAPTPPPGTVDTAGVGVNPPTAGGQVVDTAAVPGPTDTAAGTPTAP